jgi:outer membrane receptor protein involved in Fe transport
VNLVCSYDEGSNASPSGLFRADPPFFWDDTFRKRAYQRILLESPLADGINWTIEGRHHQFDASTDGMHTDFIEEYLDYSDESWGISSRVTYDTNDVNRFLLGFDGDWGTYIFDMDQFGPDYVPDTFRSANWALYLNDTYNVGRFSFTAGARYDRNYDFDSEVSPSGGVVYRFMDDKALVRAQIARGFSAPPGAWVHAPEIGNEDLKPEIGINYQLGAEASLFEYLHLEANVFKGDIDDFINIKAIEDPPWGKYENIDEVTRQGVEGVVRADLPSGLGLSFGGSFVDVRDDRTGEVIEDIPRLILNAGGYYTYPKWLTHYLAGKYIYNNSSHEETRDRVFVFDYLVRCKLPSPAGFSDISVFLAVHDLTDAGYLYRAVFPQPGRWVEGGLSLEF